ncbi:hypothetical protein [Streptomyces sp. NPDC088915]|uniref:hypothetical protein n=1 Tax=Streptomyces sp. NPDC088915 TaxID=3365912 RepID=UPI0037FE7705
MSMSKWSTVTVKVSGVHDGQVFAYQLTIAAALVAEGSGVPRSYVEDQARGRLLAAVPTLGRRYGEDHLRVEWSDRAEVSSAG